MRLVAQLAGEGWALSLQRARIAPRPGLSPNLGAAPLAPGAAPEPAWLATARLCRGERLWLAVEAAATLPVEARLSDGRRLAAERLGEGDETIFHQFPPLGREDVPVLSSSPGDDSAWGLAVGIGPRHLVRLVFLEAKVFDVLHGVWPAARGTPRTYAGWRLP